MVERMFACNRQAGKPADARALQCGVRATVDTPPRRR